MPFEVTIHSDERILEVVYPAEPTAAEVTDYLRRVRQAMDALGYEPTGEVTGNPEAVHAMTKDYKIYSRRVPLDKGDYTMDHTASMILQDAEGNFVGTIDNKEAAEVGLAKLRRLVAG